MGDPELLSMNSLHRTIWPHPEKLAIEIILGAGHIVFLYDVKGQELVESKWPFIRLYIEESWSLFI